MSDIYLCPGCGYDPSGDAIVDLYNYQVRIDLTCPNCDTDYRLTYSGVQSPAMTIQQLNHVCGDCGYVGDDDGEWQEQDDGSWLCDSCCSDRCSSCDCTYPNVQWHDDDDCYYCDDCRPDPDDMPQPTPCECDECVELRRIHAEQQQMAAATAELLS